MVMSTWEYIGWFFFFCLMCLLFFASFGTSRYSESSIDEYMDNLIAEESQRNGPL
jgi:hypothetical protein